MDFELHELKREFLAEADEKVREIEASLEAERSSEALDRLAYLAHQLKGAGGSYGYARISSESAQIEKAAESIVKGNVEDGVEARLRQHVANLRVEVETSMKELAG